MQTPVILSVAALLMLMPAAAQLNAGVSIGADGDAVEVDTDVGAGGVTNGTLDADIEVPEVKVEAESKANDTPRQEDSRYGRIEISQDEGEGHFVALRIASQGIQNYRAGNDTFFAAIDLGPLSAEASGARLEASFAGGRLQATDSASAGLRVDASESVDAVIRLAPAVSAELSSDRLVWLEANGRSGSLALLGNGSMEAEGDSLSIHLEPGSILRFEARTGEADAWREEQRSFASGRLGAEVGIVGSSGAHTAVADEYTVHVSNVRSSSDRVGFTVDSAAHHARALSVVLDAGLVASDVEMRFDGQPAQRVDDPSQVYAAADASMPLYSLVEVDGGLEAVVHVPGFSAHEIEFAPSSTAESEDAPGPGIVLVAGIVAAVGMARRLR